jgi:hypothetical protein
MPAHSLLIAAEPAACFAEITDYETFPQWQAAVKDVDVLARDVTWDYLDGDVKSVVEDLKRRVESNS